MVFVIGILYLLAFTIGLVIFLLFFFYYSGT